MAAYLKCDCCGRNVLDHLMKRLEIPKTATDQTTLYICPECAENCDVLLETEGQCVRPVCRCQSQ